MSWLPKREKLNPKQASEYPPAVRPLAKQVARVVLTLPWRRTETSTCRARPIHTIHRHVPLFLMVDKLMSIIYGELTTRHRFHRDSIQPETERFPVEVMREALVIMLMHRDYRHGQFTQIIRYDNRIEICNSGCSLKPDDMLGMKGSATRNDTIARVCHDTKLAETKGSGIDSMWRKVVEAGLSRPTMESDRAAATFTIRLILCHFFSEETLDWLKRFAAYALNDNQRTALVFLREVGAIDAVAYRQLTGCNPRLVAKELAGIKDKGLIIQKGRARGTYYVQAEILQESTKKEKGGLMSPPQGLISPHLPEDMPIPLVERIKTFPRRVRNEATLLSIIVDVCSWKAQTNESLAQMLNRSPKYVKKFIAKHIGKELDYLYPMMVHHPRQAYVALDKRKGTS